MGLGRGGGWFGVACRLVHLRDGQLDTTGPIRCRAGANFRTVSTHPSNGWSTRHGGDRHQDRPARRATARRDRSRAAGGAGSRARSDRESHTKRLASPRAPRRLRGRIPEPLGQGRLDGGVLACGSSTVLSHGSAAALWDLRRSTGSNVHVTVPSGAGRSRRPGIAVHRSPGLSDLEVAVHDGIPVSTVARTLLDIAGDLAPGPLERAVERSVILRLFDLHAVNATLARHPNRKGSHALSLIVAHLHDEAQLTRSKLEVLLP